MKIVAILILGCICSTSLTAQTQWIQQIGGYEGAYINALEVDSLGNSIVCGAFQGSMELDGTTLIASNNDPAASNTFVAKVDRRGKFIWFKQFGGSGRNYGITLGLDSQDNCYIVGGFDYINFPSNDPDVIQIDTATLSGPKNGSGTYYLAKLDPNGKLIWARILPPGLLLNTVDINANGNIVIAGNVVKTVNLDGVVITSPMASTGSFVALLDSSGKAKWAKSVLIDYTNFGIEGVAMDDLGKICLQGSFSGVLQLDNQNVTGGPGQYNVFFVALDENGVCQWIRSATRQDVLRTSVYYSTAKSISIDKAGNVYCAGEFWQTMKIGSNSLTANSPSQLADIYVVKFDKLGAFQWARSFGGTDNDQAWKLVLDKQSNIYVSCSGRGPIVFDQTSISTNSLIPFFFKLDKNGNVLLADKIAEALVFNVAMALGVDSALMFGGTFESNKFVDRNPRNTLTNKSNTNGYLLQYGFCVRQPGIPGDIIGVHQICSDSLSASVPIVANADYYIWESGSASVSTFEPMLDTTLNALSPNQNFFLEVSGVSACGQIGPPSKPFAIDVVALPVAPDGLTGENKVCVNGSFIVYSLPVTTASGYQWQINNEKFATTQPSLDTLLSALDVDSVFTIQVQAVNVCGPGPWSGPFNVTVEKPLGDSVLIGDCDKIKIDSDLAVKWFKDGALLEGMDSLVRVFSPEYEGVYNVVVTNSCGSVKSNAINFKPLTLSELQIPNVFTPNGDGMNETFKIDDKLIGSRLTVINRWGELVYFSDSYANEWNGGALVSGVYYYDLKNVCLSDINGIVSILR